GIPWQKILPQAAKPSEIHALAAMAKRPRSERQGPGAVYVAIHRAPPDRRHLAVRRPAGRGHAGPQRPLARAGVVKHLPLFFDLAGRRVVIVGVGAMADRRAELARSAGAAVFRLETVVPADLKGAVAV